VESQLPGYQAEQIAGTELAGYPTVVDRRGLQTTASQNVELTSLVSTPVKRPVWSVAKTRTNADAGTSRTEMAPEQLQTVEKPAAGELSSDSLLDDVFEQLAASGPGWMN
jgi:hypothetical protein